MGPKTKRLVKKVRAKPKVYDCGDMIVIKKDGVWEIWKSFYGCFFCSDSKNPIKEKGRKVIKPGFAVQGWGSSYKTLLAALRDVLYARKIEKRNERRKQ